jgi:hypothetical protein
VATAIMETLQEAGQPMRAADIAQAIQAKGVVKRKNPTKQIWNALPRLEGVKRIGRGLYTSKA